MGGLVHLVGRVIGETATWARWIGRDQGPATGPRSRRTWQWLVTLGTWEWSVWLTVLAAALVLAWWLL